jgi:hypothetical protein
MDEIVKFITAVEIAASFTWARWNTEVSDWIPFVKWVNTAVAWRCLMAAAWSFWSRIVVVFSCHATLAEIIQPVIGSTIHTDGLLAT